jgi:hypothetical protein
MESLPHSVLAKSYPLQIDFQQSQLSPIDPSLTFYILYNESRITQRINFNFETSLYPPSFLLIKIP